MARAPRSFLAPMLYRRDPIYISLPLSSLAMSRWPRQLSRKLENSLREYENRARRKIHSILDREEVKRANTWKWDLDLEREEGG